MLSRHWNEIHWNDRLFARVDARHMPPTGPALRRTGRACWSATRTDSARAAQDSERAAKQRLKEIGERLASLGTAFGQNVLADEQSYVLPLARAISRVCRIRARPPRAAPPRSAA
jgi:peptidyl-dipeptidase Dcp